MTERAASTAADRTAAVQTRPELVLNRWVEPVRIHDRMFGDVAALRKQVKDDVAVHGVFIAKDTARMDMSDRQLTRRIRHLFAAKVVSHVATVSQSCQRK